MKKWMIISAGLLAIFGFILNVFFEGIWDSGQYSSGYFASGQFAIGVFAAGHFSIGIFSIGTFSIGIFSLGIFNIAFYSIGFFVLNKKHSIINQDFFNVRSKKVFLATGIALIMLIANQNAALAQIPNGDFEIWTDQGNYMEPNGFASPNGLTANNQYAITRSEDVPLGSSGKYSIKIESRPHLMPAANAYGILLQNSENDFLAGMKPAFPIKEKIRKLEGKFKYFPQYEDSMIALILIYNKGAIVATGEFTSSDTTKEWTSFSININEYNEADSAAILLSSYYAMGGPPDYIPNGNSTLYIDDLQLISGSNSESTPKINSTIKVFPNPTHSLVKLSGFNLNNIEKLVLVNSIGQQQEVTFDENKELVINGKSGIYFLELYLSDQSRHLVRIVKLD